MPLRRFHAEFKQIKPIDPFGSRAGESAHSTAKITDSFTTLLGNP
jgi:hypothetical protein